MCVDTTNTDPLRARLTDPGSGVLPIAGGDGYPDAVRMIPLRGAVGAVERTREPFTSRRPGPTLTVPLSILAGPGAPTLALR
jgi:hypothetical protein